MATIRRSMVVSILFTVFGGPGLVLVYLPWWMTHFHIPAGEPFWQIMIAAVLIAAELTPLMDSMIRFVYAGRGTLMPTVPTEHLVVSGLYRYVRNPMYVGVLTALIGETVLFWNWDLVIECAIFCLAVELFVRLSEEPELAHSFPAEYLQYKQHVRRWVPRLTPWEAAGSKLDK